MLTWFFTEDHTNIDTLAIQTHTHTQTHNQLAAANPGIKASVTDVISGYICDKKRKRAEQTNAKQHAPNIH